MLGQLFTDRYCPHQLMAHFEVIRDPDAEENEFMAASYFRDPTPDYRGIRRPCVVSEPHRVHVTPEGTKWTTPKKKESAGWPGSS